MISKDYVPRNNIDDEQTATIRLNPEDNKVQFVQDKAGNFVFNAIVNAYTQSITYNQNADFTVSQKQAMELLMNGAINRHDFIGDNIEKIITEGAIKDRSVFIIREMRIADRTVQNIEVTVFNNQKNDWVIGAKALKKFGDFEFNTEEHKLIFK